METAVVLAILAGLFGIVTSLLNLLANRKTKAELATLRDNASAGLAVSQKAVSEATILLLEPAKKQIASLIGKLDGAERKIDHLTDELDRAIDTLKAHSIPFDPRPFQRNGAQGRR